MKIGNPAYWIFLLPLAVALFLYYAKKKRKRDLLLLVNHVNLPHLMRDLSLRKQNLKIFLFVAFFLVAGMAFIRPKWGFHWEEVKRRGVDIIVALDVSKSMLAEDISPNRLERAKRKIVDLIQILQGDRVGLVAFAGVAFLQAPLTLDYGAVSIFLKDLDTELIPIQGTAVGEAISVAQKSFDQKDKKSRVLILITDGEDHLGEPLERAKEAAKDGIIIYTVGIGALEGAPIPDLERGGFKKDRNGEVVMTKLDETTLQKIALETGGSYVRSVSGDLDLEKIYQDINEKVQDKDLKSGKRKRFEERYQWFLFLALLILLWEMWITESKTSNTGSIRRKFFGGRKLWRAQSWVWLLLGLSLWGFPQKTWALWGFSKIEKAQKFYEKGQYDKALKNYLDQKIERPEDPENNYNLANSYYKMKEFDKGEELYSSVVDRGDENLRQKSLYNLGNVYFEKGKLKESIESFESALAIDPEDADAKHNLAFVRDELKRRLEEMKKRQENQKSQQNQNQKQQGQQNQQQEKQEGQEGQKGQQGQQQNQNQQQPNQDQENQQSGEEQKQAQAKEQSSGDDQKEEEEKEEGEGGAKEEEEDKNKEEQEKEQGAQAGEQRDQNKSKEPEQDQAEGQRAYGVRENTDARNQDKKQMNQQEAMRWLNNLEEGRKEYLKKNMMPKGSQYSVGRDW